MSTVWERLKEPEGALLERKQEGDFRGCRRTIVAFANSVSFGEVGILFIGVDDDGKPSGCANVDSTCHSLRETCKNDVYPPIICQFDTRTIEGKEVIAVAVPYSAERPHFDGHSYKRVGTSSVKADEESHKRFIASRTDVGALIVQRIGQVVEVEMIGKRLGNHTLIPGGYHAKAQYSILDCTPHTARFRALSSDQIVVEQLENLHVSYDAMGQFKLLAKFP